MRRTDGCINCGETREMAAHGLCFKCYRRAGRAEQKESLEIDRHTLGVRKEHAKIFRGFIRVMSGLGDLGVSRALVLEIRRLIEPYLSPISVFLAAPEADKDRNSVNGEQVDPKSFTVHSNPNQSLAAIEEGLEQGQHSENKL
jgi:hypothetical protein